jgi:hypothetical protein
MSGVLGADHDGDVISGLGVRNLSGRTTIDVPTPPAETRARRRILDEVVREQERAGIGQTCSVRIPLEICGGRLRGQSDGMDLVAKAA